MIKEWFLGKSLVESYKAKQINELNMNTCVKNVRFGLSMPGITLSCMMGILMGPLSLF